MVARCFSTMWWGVVAEFCLSHAWYSEVLFKFDERERSESVLTEPLVDELVETYDFGVSFFEVDDCSAVARMRVPKLAKNGFNSFLRASKCSRRPVAARKSRGNAKPKTDGQNGIGE
jgi:hypothetical protein